MMPICELIIKDDKPNYCARHNMYHPGHLALRAVDPGPVGQSFRDHWDKKQLPRKPLLRSLPIAKTCQHYLGDSASEKIGCGSKRKVSCAIKGEVSQCFCLQSCMQFCRKETAETPKEPAADRDKIRFDHLNLHPGTIPGVRFNSTIIQSGEGYLYAFRNGWRGSNIYICELTKDFVSTERWSKLDLGKRGATVGREDPRLFRLNGKLHLWYIGYSGRVTNVLFARINEETLEVEDRFFPQLKERESWEKNWAFFDYQGIAHAVYSIKPHRILRIEGDKAELIHTTPYDGTWSGGHMRGGASPVLHNSEFYHFFHGSTSIQGRRTYNMGLVTFNPDPPFNITRFTPHPIDVADHTEAHDNYCHVLFPGGAVYQDGQWIIAHGIHDRWSEIRKYNAEWVESLLVDV